MKKNENYTTDAKGTAIVLKEDEEPQEMIFLSRGSVSIDDWIDNLLGIGVGSGGANYATDSTVFFKRGEKGYWV